MKRDQKQGEKRGRKGASQGAATRVAPLILLLLVTAALTVAWQREAQAEGSTVVGEVKNGTPGFDVPAGLTVTLHTFSEMEETAVYTSTVSEEGSFQFDDLPLEEGRTVVARTFYDSVTYVSEFVTLEQPEEEISLPVTIYETTEDPAEVMVTQLHLFLNRAGQRMQVAEYAVIGNLGNRTYIGSEELDVGGGEKARATWTARLPDGAANLQFDSAMLGGRFVPVEDGFADTRPVPPGDASVETSFTYELPLQYGIEIAQSFDLPVRSAVLVMPEGEWGMEGPGISAQGAIDTQMGAALSYSAGPLEAGEALSFAMVPRAASAPQTVERSSSNGLFIGLAALLAAAVVVVVMWRSPSSQAIPAEVRPQVDAIAALDRDFEHGRVSESTYREKRQSLKRQVRHILSDQRS